MAPSGVHYRPLGEVATFRRGSVITRSGTVHGDVPVVAGGRAPAYFHAEANRVGESLTVAGSGAYAGYVGYWNCPIFVSDAFTVHPDAKLLRVKYVYYFLCSKQEELHALKQGGGVPHVHGKDLAPLVIPVAPIAIQDKIVNILDQFTALQAELEAELEARHHQYAYYRDLLLAFPEPDVRRVALGEVANIVRGASPRPIQDFLSDNPNDIPWIKIGDTSPDGKYITSTAQRITTAGARKSRRVYPGDFVLSNSMSFGRPYLMKIEGCIHDGWLSISSFEDHLIPDFLYHLLRSKAVQADFARNVGTSSVSNLNSEIVKSIVIPIPPLDVQARIVEVLDRFEVLVNSLSDGLPAELAARRKQHEYYRDKLLTFEEATT